VADWRLLAVLKETLEVGVGQMILEAPGRGKDHISPTVFIGKVDIKQAPAKEKFPFVAVCPSALQILPEERRAEVSLLLGVFNESQDPEDGLHDLDNLAGMVEAALIGSGADLLGRYDLNLPMDVFHDLEIRHPYYLAEIVTRWRWWRETDIPLLEN
jgi:hypothetical protein